MAGAVFFLGSLLAYELSHAVVARRNGVRVRSITLWMLRLLHVLGGEQHGRVAGDELLNELPELVTRSGVKCRRRLVEKKDRWTANETGG